MLLAVDVDPTPITAWFALGIAIVTTVTLITGVIVRVNRRFEKRVTELIKETTLPIQAETNGGLSLTDLHNKVDTIQHRYERVIENEENQREAWHLRYLADQARIRKEWIAFFIGIRHIMKHPQEKQIEMWDDLTQSYIDGSIVDKYPDERMT